jgi:hypothetical protein
MNLPTNVTRVFYQSHEPHKLVFETNLTHGTPQFHDNGPLPLAISWIFQPNFINIFALCGFIILTLRLCVSHSLPSHCSWVPLRSMFTCKPLALMSVFLGFHYNTSKPEASNVGCSMFFDYCTLNQTTQTQCDWSVQSCGFWECSVVVELIVGRVLAREQSAKRVLECGVHLCGI